MPNKEIEIKLLIAKKDIDAFLNHPLLMQTGQQALHYCYSTYYDSIDHQLAKRGFALRLREDNGQFVQTLKGSNLENTSGLHERCEWEWVLPNDQLDLNLLPDEIKSFVMQLDLQPVFITDFTRQCWDLYENNHHIEIALDRGEIRSGHFNEPICEVELEIKTGDKTGLIALAQVFKKTIPLKPFDISKAERGYRLHTIHRSNSVN